ncbi:ankyrin repeat-containing domain protein [Hypoxylon sp. NC1633]|nr:ankyrin repeat-containing domain protein [Hypoxylon sp. NC1633]
MDASSDSTITDPSLRRAIDHRARESVINSRPSVIGLHRQTIKSQFHSPPSPNLQGTNTMPYHVTPEQKLVLLNKIRLGQKDLFFSILNALKTKQSTIYIVLLLQCVDNSGRNIGHYSAQCGSKTTLEILQRLSSMIKPPHKKAWQLYLNARDTRGNTPFLEASEQGANAIATYLLTQGADLHAVNAFRETALHLATRKGHRSSMALLMDRGVAINAQNRDGDTPGHIAARCGMLDVTDDLLARGASTKILNRQGRDMLSVAVQEGEWEIEALVRYYRDVTVQNSDSAKNEMEDDSDWVEVSI